MFSKTIDHEPRADLHQADMPGDGHERFSAVNPNGPGAKQLNTNRFKLVNQFKDEHSVEPTNDQARTVFGKRYPDRSARPTAISSDFFSKNQNSPAAKSMLVPIRSHRQDLSGASSDVNSSGDTYHDDVHSSRKTMKMVAIVAVFSLFAPAAFVALANWTMHQNNMSMMNPSIDNGVTASIGSSGTSGRIKIDNTSFTRLIRNGTASISVNGSIKNTSQSAALLPLIAIEMRDENNQIVQTWRHRINVTMMEPGQSFRFITSALDLTGTAVSVSAKIMPTNQSN